MTNSPPSIAASDLDRYTVTLDRNSLEGRAFLLGDRGGFVLYLPASRNTQDRTLHASKWFGASGFGRSFFEGFEVWVEHDGQLVALDRRNQTEFVMRLDEAVRVYRIGDHEVREHYFVPDGWQAVVMTLETDLPWVVKPEFDMRYYQAFNADFSHYGAEDHDGRLTVSNLVEESGPLRVPLNFFGVVDPLGSDATLEMLPADQWLIEKTYRTDRQREEIIKHAYAETQAHSPDEAPIWDAYRTQVFAPARFRLAGSGSLILAFGDTLQEAQDSCTHLSQSVPAVQLEKRATIALQLETGYLETGNAAVDTAYAQVLTRFNTCLVARDATLHVDPVHREHFYGIFAGNKYFMDAWKRDENISLAALFATGDYETVRQILDSTWQYQDDRTGRLPHILRAGEPLVYYSSDGTLWALHRLLQYTAQSGDAGLLQAKMSMVERFFAASLGFVQRGLLPSGGIIDPNYLWETWEDTPFTPRDGFPVEIELLWLTVLNQALPFVRKVNGELAQRMADTLDVGRQTFGDFVRDGYLVDSISYDWKTRDLLTPNGYVAFGVGFSLPPDLSCSMVKVARDQLAGHRGVRSLAPRDWASVLPADFLADPTKVRGKDMASVGIFNYHRGIEWQWFNAFFLQGELDCGTATEGYRRYVQDQVRGALDDGGIGGLGELYALQGQLGADFQAWSMAAFIDSLHRFAGMGVNALTGEVWLCPTIPASWPYLCCRSRVGNVRFELRYEEMGHTTRFLEVTLLDPAPASYCLHLGFRIPPGGRAAKATCNGDSISTDRWTYQEGCAPGVPGYAWLTVPLQQSVRLECALHFDHTDA